MTLVVLGIDALDPDLVDPDRHPNLTLAAHKPISTIVSAKGEPSTHELWPTIITGLEPEEHGLLLDDGVTWENPLIAGGSRIGRYILPDGVRTRVGAWLLNATKEDAFRTPATYYQANGIETVFDGIPAVAIGIPNYVTAGDADDREHQLRRSLGDLFERDPDETSGHRSSDPDQFYERCLEMAMIRIARVRRALRSRRYELVFGYTSGLDLVGHVAYDRPGMVEAAYGEFDEFVGELRHDLGPRDELLLVSDHGLQNGVHTDAAMVAATEPDLLDHVDGVTSVRDGIEYALRRGDHTPSGRTFDSVPDPDRHDRVAEQLEDLGYL